MTLSLEKSLDELLRKNMEKSLEEPQKDCMEKHQVHSLEESQGKSHDEQCMYDVFIRQSHQEFRDNQAFLEIFLEKLSLFWSSNQH